MSFEEEWAGLKAAAAARMELNSTPEMDPHPSPSDADLVVFDDELGKIGHSAYLLHNHLKSDGKHAQTQTRAAGASLKDDGFATGAALIEVSKVWEKQIGTLLDACAHISNHLDFSKKLKKKDDEFVAATISASKISDYYDVPEGEPQGSSGAPSVPKPEGPII
ncbi:hypothetical protein ACQB60_33820 [Actinomycetota bacterium Odt1-20B]